MFLAQKQCIFKRTIEKQYCHVIKRAINQVLSVNVDLFCSIFHEYEFIQSANFIFLWFLAITNNFRQNWSYCNSAKSHWLYDFPDFRCNWNADYMIYRAFFHNLRCCEFCSSDEITREVFVSQSCNCKVSTTGTCFEYPLKSRNVGINHANNLEMISYCSVSCAKKTGGRLHNIDKYC